MFTDKLNTTVCNIFKETMVDGQLCYQADVDRFRDKVDMEKIVTKGLFFVLDYNENRMVDVGSYEDDGVILIGTIGKK